tara:strand:+ start:25108 stop:25224 length:117 start_codon:yes stop_codon:yes gene_type:complete
MKWLRKLWEWFQQEEGMTWERYARNIENDKRRRKNGKQ